MKRESFNYAFGLMMNALMLAITFASCTKKTNDLKQTENAVEIATASAGGRPTSLPVISLRVTINDAAGNNITSDGKGDYLNGTDYVQAILDQSGTFAFNTFSPPAKVKNAVVKRWVIYNFNNPVDQANTYRPSPDFIHNYHFSTGGTTLGTNPFIPLQNLEINSSECIYMGNGISNNTATWKVSFHKGLENTTDSPTAFAVVTRVSTNVWTITPVGSCSSNSNVAGLRNNANDFLYGYYYLPFSFTLTKL